MLTDISSAVKNESRQESPSLLSSSINDDDNDYSPNECEHPINNDVSANVIRTDMQSLLTDSTSSSSSSF